ncbi:MAG TPA: ATP-binding protein [Ktedonobacteraceae bacterium]|jgi:PAS domain S-box-containing protein|nr:ATP-binding protein [Ktedonobacteraceae bacterium]
MNDFDFQQSASNNEEQLLFLACIARSISDALIVIDINGRVISWNDAAEKLYGWTSREVLGQDAMDLFHPDLSRSIKKAWHQQVKDHGRWKGETLHRRKDGTNLDILVSISEVKDGKGNVLGYVLIHHDITEQKELERRKDDFISIAGHELRTPITSIQGYTEILSMLLEEEGRHDLTKYLTRMSQQLKRLGNMVEELLDISRMRVGQLVFTQSTFEFDPLIEEVINDVQQTTSTHTIYLHGSSGKTIIGDRERLGQALTNLLINAIKYSPRATKIDVTITEEDEQVLVHVHDYGIGISKNQQQKIFERFYQVPEKKQQQFPGLGIGLTLAADIIHHHSGKIWVTSEEGYGSTFSFALPVKAMSIAGML